MSKSKEKLVASFEEACESQGLDPLQLPIVDHLLIEHQRSVVAFYKLSIINGVLNGDWRANWQDYNEYKYYPWFFMDKDGSGFSFAYFGFASDTSTVGSRLVFRTRSLAEYAGKQFLDLYKEWMILE